MELSDLVNCMQNAKFQGLDYAYINCKSLRVDQVNVGGIVLNFSLLASDKTYHVSSLSEKKCKKVISQETPERLIKYTANFAAKVYPAFYRQLSSNLEALDYWRYGFQIGK